MVPSLEALPMSNNPYGRDYGYANPNHMQPAGQQNSAVVSMPSIG